MKKLITCLIVSVLCATLHADSKTDDRKAGFDNIQAAVDASSDGDEIFEHFIPLHVASGGQTNTSHQTKTVFSYVVRVDEASSLQIQFGRTALPKGTMLRTMSLQDGAMQHHTATTLKQWQGKSAWFNGSAVLVELIADSNTSSTHVTIDGVIIIEQLGDDRSICGATDDRVLSFDNRVGRTSLGCTAWIIDDGNRTFLTAGHCVVGGAGDIAVIEFNVPLSDLNGSYQHPGPEDQYAGDPESLQSSNGRGHGDDWAYFGCFPNTETGMTPYEAQGDFYVLADAAPPVNGQQITITGYGSTMDTELPNQWNGVQKTHTGPYVINSGSSIGYQTDTTGGNSGSAVLNEETGEAIGIHTNGGCNSSGGQNNGTPIENEGLQFALANPQGVCAAVGACCIGSSGNCVELYKLDCIAGGGNWQGLNSVCENGCEQLVLGACCVGEQCIQLFVSPCLAGGGIWVGSGISCEGDTCNQVPCEGDADGSGAVEVGDLLAVIDQWGSDDSAADINDDGIVDVSDLLIVIGNWGPCE